MDNGGGKQVYALQQRILSKTPRLPISEAQFEALRKARTVLSEALSIEEIYGILVANYGDFERTLVSTSVDAMVGSNFSYDYFFSVRQEIGRRVVNLLTATKLYIDQIQRHVRRAVPEEGEEAWTDIKKLLGAAYDQNFEYRFMEALRNRTQHRGVPADTFTLGGGRDDGGHLSFRTDAYATKESISMDRKFKRSVVDEMPDRVDLKGAVRVYVSLLSEIHGSLRSRISSSVNASRELLEATIASYTPFEGNKPVGLQALCFVGDDVIDSFPLMLDWDDTRLKLVERNKILRGLAKHFVTSRISEETRR